ncbi:hypothetical protein HDU98_002389 [Podochytrium sp. JEL0797]|nr:hypothetical protein HDU98_002389 [Podochytrium sp. JEL0797]
MDTLFTIDRKGAGASAAPPPEQVPVYETFIPLSVASLARTTTTTTSITYRTPHTTRPFQTTPRQTRTKGKGRFKAGAKKTPNYGFKEPKVNIDWRGRPGANHGEDSTNDDALRDYLANMSVDEDQRDFRVSALADPEGLGVGGFSASEESEEDAHMDPSVAKMLKRLQRECSASDDNSNSDSPGSDPVKSAPNLRKSRLDLPESGLFEALTTLLDADALAEMPSNSEHSSNDDDDSDEDSIDLANIYIEGDNDEDDSAPPFTGGKSKWSTTTTSSHNPTSPASKRANKTFDKVHNGSFRNNRNSYANDNDSETDSSDDYGNNRNFNFGPTGVPLPSSKSAKKKQGKRDRKLKRDKDRELRAALKEEPPIAHKQQSRIAHTVAKKKSGAAIDVEIQRILHKVNKTMHSFTLLSDATTALPAMPGALRRLVKLMATHYQLTTTQRGKHGDKQVILHRNKQSRVPTDWETIVDRVMSTKGNTVLKGNTWSGKKTQKAKRRVTPGAPDDRAVLRPGDVVGEGAAPISEENVGHRMMRVLGWSPGEVLGAGVAVRGASSSMTVTRSVWEVRGEEEDGVGSSSMSGFYLGGGIGFSAGQVVEESEGGREERPGFKLLDPISVTVRARRRGLGAE